MRRPVSWRERVAARIDRGNRGVAGQRHAQRFDHAGHGRGRAHGHAMALGTAHAGLGGEEFFDSVILPGAHLFGHLPHAGARAEFALLVMPLKHRAARQADGRQVARSRAHHQRRRGLVAAHQQHDAVDRIAADRLLHIHAGEIAEQHGGGAQVGLAQGHHREFEGEAAGLADAALHPLGDVAEMRVAGRQFRPGVADADHRAAVEQVVRISLVLHPAAMDEAVAVLQPEPFMAAQPVPLAHVPSSLCDAPSRCAEKTPAPDFPILHSGCIEQVLKPAQAMNRPARSGQ